MTRALGPEPSPTPGGTGICRTVLGVCWGLVALDGIVWAAARVAAQVCGGHAEPFGIKFGSDVLHGRTAAAWPAISFDHATVTEAVTEALTEEDHPVGVVGQFAGQRNARSGNVLPESLTP